MAFVFLQMAARDTGVGAVETLLHQGKLLALDLLVKVFENPLHTWQNVRPQVSPQFKHYFWEIDTLPCTCGRQVKNEDVHQ